MSSTAPLPDTRLAPPGPRCPIDGPETEPLSGPPLGVLITVPTLDAGAADEGAVALAGILAGAGHRPVVASRGGRLEDRLAGLGADFVRLDTATRNPLMMARNAAVLRRLVRERGCDVVHAHGRTSAWSAYVAAKSCGVPFVTTCYTGFRDQNLVKHWYNGVMARGALVIAVSDPVGELMAERHRVPPERLAVIHPGLDLDGFDPAGVAPERVAAMRSAWGVGPDTRVVLVPGRIIRRHGHHVAVQAAWRLKKSGLEDIVFVLDGEDGGRSRYSGELWDLVLASGTADMIRITGPSPDPPASCAAATVVANAAIQLDGFPRGLLEAMAMARPVVASDLAAGPETVLSAPVVGDDRTTGLRVPAGDDAALAAGLLRMLSLSDPQRHAMGQRARALVLGLFDRAVTAEQTLAAYARVTAARRGTERTPSRAFAGPRR